jgi:hypothetical protein
MSEFLFSVEGSFALPMFSYFVPGSKEGGVEQDILINFCCTWGDF